MILAVDTAFEFGSLALTSGAEVLEEISLQGKDGFGGVLFGELKALLARHGVKVGEIECFAAANGPGSFTGVRMGLAFAKGLAEACGRPVAAVSNLAALASLGTSHLRAPVLDARRGDVYVALYDAAGALVMPETVAKLAEWLETAPAGVEIVSAMETPRPLAGAVGRLAARMPWLDPAAIDANYVRRSDAEMAWKEV